MTWERRGGGGFIDIMTFLYEVEGEVMGRVFKCFLAFIFFYMQVFEMGCKWKRSTSVALP